MELSSCVNEIAVTWELLTFQAGQSPYSFAHTPTRDNIHWLLHEEIEEKRLVALT